MVKCFLLIFAMLTMLFSGCQKSCTDKPPHEFRITGLTMGTFYSVVIATHDQHPKISKAELKKQIDARLEEICDIFSTYRPQSTISRFNRSTSTEKMVVDSELAHVVERAIAISTLTNGAFNVALDPLIDLWGFDKSGRITKKPDQAAIREALRLSDPSKIKLEGRAIRKADGRMSINLSGIAKGWAVDDIANFLGEQGFANFMVEIGGEIVTRGDNSRKQPWVIGIENPRFIGDQAKFIARVELQNKALASSGIYLNFFIEDGIKYSHIIDPRTGYPLRHGLVSVTVIASDCMTADALATAAMVMGEAKTRRVIDKIEGAGAMFVLEKDGELMTSFAGGFKRLSP